MVGLRPELKQILSRIFHQSASIQLQAKLLPDAIAWAHADGESNLAARLLVHFGRTVFQLRGQISNAETKALQLMRSAFRSFMAQGQIEDAKQVLQDMGTAAYHSGPTNNNAHLNRALRYFQFSLRIGTPYEHDVDCQTTLKLAKLLRIRPSRSKRNDIQAALSRLRMCRKQINRKAVADIFFETNLLLEAADCYNDRLDGRQRLNHQAAIAAISLASQRIAGSFNRELTLAVLGARGRTYGKIARETQSLDYARRAIEAQGEHIRIAKQDKTNTELAIMAGNLADSYMTAQATKLHHRGIDRARALTRIAVALIGKNPSINSDRAWLLNMLADAIVCHPNQREPKEYEHGVKCYEQACALVPVGSNEWLQYTVNHANALLSCAHLELHERNDRAFALYESVLGKNPGASINLHAFFYNYGVAILQSDNQERGLRCIDDAMSLLPPPAMEAHLLVVRGKLLHELARECRTDRVDLLQSAERSLRKALHIAHALGSETLVETISGNLGYYLSENRNGSAADATEAVSLLECATERWGGEVTQLGFMVALGDAHLRSGNLRAALQAYARATAAYDGVDVYGSFHIVQSLKARLGHLPAHHAFVLALSGACNEAATRLMKEVARGFRTQRKLEARLARNQCEFASDERQGNLQNSEAAIDLWERESIVIALIHSPVGGGLLFSRPTRCARNWNFIHCKMLTTAAVTEMLYCENGWWENYRRLSDYNNAGSKASFNMWASYLKRLPVDLKNLLNADAIDFLHESIGGLDAVWICLGALGNLPPLALVDAPASAKKDKHFKLKAFCSGAISSRTVLRRPQKALFIQPSIMPFSDLELSALARATRGELIVLKGTDATPEAIASAAGLVDVTHFAVHGDWVWHRASTSQLVNTSITVSSLLGAQDFEARGAVVLAACSSGMSENYRAIDEYVGFPAAFMSRGASEVIATLWPVESPTAALVMSKMYLLLGEKEGLEIAAALRSAQAWLRNANERMIVSHARELGLGPDQVAALRVYIEREYFHSIKAEGWAAAGLQLRFARSVGRWAPFSNPHHWAGYVSYT